ncbi:unnamed protein product [Nesidiocoris tenuis]|uniref:Integrase catalytic domain-containing protein n=1 Tax=Nesidiocoris tenuis TaxID=355587 RepID=A0A6H5FTX0_9HEMI|nr:unnamed protein product [Nesidiocoris tenuis]
METLTGKKIKFIQSDNGTEYCNKEFDRYLQAHGISRRLTIPHTPQQNGVAERENRSLVEMARCLMVQAKLPPSFWGEAIYTANYIRNRCPSKGIDGETPFKLWKGKEPSVHHFRSFGCNVFYLDKLPQKDKFANRAKSGIFIGYSEVNKGYRIWSKQEQRVIVSRDVKFVDEFSDNKDSDSFVPMNLFKPTSRKTGNGNKQQQYLLNDKNPTREDHNITNEEHNIENNENITNDEDEERIVNDQNIHLNEPSPVPTPVTTPNPGQERVRTIRGRGRPRIERTGSRGRPRKIYCEVPVAEPDVESEGEIDSTEEAGLAELTVKKAFSREDAHEWRKAVMSEYSSIIENKTFVIVNRPENKNVISSRVILAEKLKADGTVERKKARLVAKGYSQKIMEDYNETFAPVVRMSSIRTMMALAVENVLEIRQLDVTTAFLNGDLYEEIYMEIPEKFEEIASEIVADESTPKNIMKDAKAMLGTLKVDRKNKICLLKKSLYGLKQAGRQRYLKLDENLKKLGLMPLKSEPCLYTAQRGDDTLIRVD